MNVTTKILQHGMDCYPNPLLQTLKHVDTADGLSSVADDGFRESFIDVYSASSLRSVPWHAVSLMAQSG